MKSVTIQITRVLGKSDTYIDVCPGDAGGVILTANDYRIRVILDSDGVHALRDALSAAAFRAKQEETGR